MERDILKQGDVRRGKSERNNTSAKVNSEKYVINVCIK